MPGLVPGIHDFLHGIIKDVDGRDKPGHDGGATHPSLPTSRSIRAQHLLPSFSFQLA
jgi:hypothetical protein